MGAAGPTQERRLAARGPRTGVRDGGTGGALTHTDGRAPSLTSPFAGGGSRDGVAQEGEGGEGGGGGGGGGGGVVPPLPRTPSEVGDAVASEELEEEGSAPEDGGKLGGAEGVVVAPPRQSAAIFPPF